MNKLLAEITEINSSGDLSLVTLHCQGELFSSIIINHQEDYIQKGNIVYMVFKETEVSIGKNLNGGLSIRNRFKSVIENIDKGTLLSELKLNFKGQLITSIITTSSAEKLELQLKEEVEGLLKTTELFIMKYE
ncbi:MAG TPA: TOBE domain-containing protein [Cytophagaceae bacterium]|jgi:molybdate transport system regulatory protein|nr:TOBE domain-containing protein [Cytophagaceae bacterium]